MPAALTLDAPIRLELVHVPAGPFTMGSDPARDSFAQLDEMPQHRVTLRAYYIARYEVTNAQYVAFARARGIAFTPPAGKDGHPAVHMSWHEAVAFCDWLSAESGRAFRLPTEAEWEKAARGVDGRLYPWGDAWDRAALNSGDGDVSPVQAHSPAGDSPYGAADMAGNVWEWTADWYQPDAYAARAAVIDPVGAPEGTHRVLRGGSHFFRQGGTRAAKRYKYIPTSRCYDIGFRVVMAAP